MNKVQQKVYLITEKQRDALLNYLLNRPYREVANGVQFLTNAPSTILNMEIPDEESANMSGEQASQLIPVQDSHPENFNSAQEELAVFSRA